jgi:hypothetical protein
MEPDKIISYTNSDIIDVYDLEPDGQMVVIFDDFTYIGNVFSKRNENRNALFKVIIITVALFL